MVYGALPCFQRRFPIVSIKVTRWRYSYSKLPLSYEVVENRSTGFWTTILCAAEDPKTFFSCRGLLLPCGKVWSSSELWIACAKPGNEEKRIIFAGWVKTTVLFLAISGPKFIKFWDNVGNLRSFHHYFRIVYIVFLSRDSGPRICHWVAKSSKNGSFWAPFFLGGVDTQNLSVVFYCRPIYVMC